MADVPAVPVRPGSVVPLPLESGNDSRAFFIDWGVNLFGLVSVGLILWGQHWFYLVLGSIVVMMLLIRLIWKIRRLFNREALRWGNQNRPKGTPEGRKLQ